MAQQGLEIDFLPVGNGDRAGDAIVLRYGNLYGPRQGQRVIVVDGGFADTAESVVSLVRDFYGTDFVDLVVSTHPDADHSAGLAVVLDELAVGELWMHLPWRHRVDIARMIQDGRVTDASVSAALRRDLEDARALEAIARRKGIRIVEPFTGVSDGAGLFVLGPDVGYYEGLLPHFRATPAPKTALEAFFEKLAEATSSVFETLSLETLTDDGDTSAENNSSVILLLSWADQQVLLTGDAGAPALTRALDALDAGAPGFRNLTWVQVPHHDSRRNVGPTLLNRLLGAPGALHQRRRTAMVSAPTTPPAKHPSKRVTNAFHRRGAPVHATCGNSILHTHNAPQRIGYGAVAPIPFHATFDE
jgi:beta-lactamase superfamily II metal-dependent hydrolase